MQCSTSCSDRNWVQLFQIGFDRGLMIIYGVIFIMSLVAASWVYDTYIEERGVEQDDVLDDNREFLPGNGDHSL